MGDPFFHGWSLLSSYRDMEREDSLKKMKDIFRYRRNRQEYKLRYEQFYETMFNGQELQSNNGDGIRSRFQFTIANNGERRNPIQVRGSFQEVIHEMVTQRSPCQRSVFLNPTGRCSCDGFSISNEQTIQEIMTAIMPIQHNIPMVWSIAYQHLCLTLCNNCHHSFCKFNFIKTNQIYSLIS